MKCIYTSLVFLLASLCIFPLTGLAQCSKTLKNAQRAFEAGKIERIPLMLSECLEYGGFSRQEEIMAYRLLLDVYLFQDQEASAEFAMESLLKLEPEYNFDPTIDAPEVLYLYNSFRTRPVMRVNISSGINISVVDVMTHYTVEDESEALGEYGGRIGTMTGGTVSFPVLGSFDIGVGAYYLGRSYGYGDSILNTSTIGIITDTISIVGLKQIHHTIEVPVTLMYTLGIKNKWKLQPYVYGGLSFNYLVKAIGTEVSIQTPPNEKVTATLVDMTSLRNPITYNAVGGGGFRYKLGVDFLTFEFRATIGLNNVVDWRKRYSDPTLLYEYSYVDSDFRLFTYGISLGYLRSIHIPKRKKRYRTEY